jgi:amino acid adenylation domain-containing protein
MKRPRHIEIHKELAGSSKMAGRIEQGGGVAGSPVFSSLEDMIAHYGRTAPRRKAILALGQSPLTYAGLRARINEIVFGLRKLGIGRHDRLAILMPNGPENAIAAIAAAAGAVCVPLNPRFTADECQRYFPELRLAAVLTLAGASVPGRNVAKALGIPVIELSPLPGEGLGAFSLHSSEMRPLRLDEPAAMADDDAIVLLTSGSTSRPKSVPLTQANICLSARNVVEALVLEGQDRLLNVLPLFHAHGLISGLMGALAGGSGVICTPGFDPAAFFGWLTEFRPTWYTAVPSFHRAILSAADRLKLGRAPSSLRLLRSASASLPADVLNKLEALFGVPVIDTYGMTEGSSQIASNPLAWRKPGSVGRATGPEIAILDHSDRFLAPGEQGEIALRGPTITRGYENDLAATASAFRNGWFRTGDLGYLDPDGFLFIVGRSKEVIKRGGLQVAPAEVEDALLCHPDVVEAVAFSVPQARLGEDVAVAIVARPDAELSPHQIRSFARERIASYKVPGLIHLVPAIPKSSTGKVNRSDMARALGIASPVASADGSPVPPRSDAEVALADMWAEILEVEQIAADQDVFALGADSLAVTQMLSRVREHFGVALSFEDIFDSPSVDSLGARLRASERGGDAQPPGLGLESADPATRLLSFQQQRVHVLSELDPASYHVIEVARLSGSLDVDALASSLATICERHEVLRSHFFVQRGEPRQRAGTMPLRLERVAIELCSAPKRMAAIRRHAQEWLRQPLDMEGGLPLQARLIRFAADDHALIVKFHHLVTDGWSQRLFWQELEALYRGAPTALPELPIQYRNFVEWQRGWLQTTAAEAQLGYWRSQLSGVGELPLRTDRPRPETKTGRGARHTFTLSQNLALRLKSLSRAQNVTLFMTLLGAFQCLLKRYTEHDDVAVTSLIANRNRMETERLIGMFANTIVLRTDLAGDPTFAEVLRRVRRITLDAYRNQDMPIEEIFRALRVPRSLDRNALLRVMFILQNAVPKIPALPGLSVEFVEVDPGTARCDLVLEIIDAGGQLGGWFEYDTDLFESDTIMRMASHLRVLLEAVLENPDTPISRLPLLPASERRRLLIDWNGTEKRSGRRGDFFRYLAKHVERTPEAIAVSAGRVRLSYRDLARRSSAIAQRLASAGTHSEAVIGLLAERGANFTAAMIAMQQAGLALLPLDPALPALRLARIIEHSRTQLVLVGRGCAALLERALSETPARARPRALNLEQAASGRARDVGAAVAPSPSRLACLIYTSGSTGVPKGVMIEQRGLCNHLLSKIGDLELSASDVVAQTAPQSFVISLWQFLSAPMVGARVHICPDDLMRDPQGLMREIELQGVTVLQVVPSLLREFLARAPDDPAFSALHRLRWLISTGEPLPPDLCREWFRLFPTVRLMNAYGQTECSDDVATCSFAAPPAALTAVPIGKPIPNTRLYVLDSHLQPTPIGVAGELYVGGIAVGRGYHDDPEQTEQRFLHDPFSKNRGARLYRTGDLARWRGDGTIECLGRTDHQVKVRGCRVELQEIEHALTQHSDVRAAAARAQKDARGEQQLIAYVIATPGCPPDVKALREFLDARLPAYMIPAGFVFLDRLPLTAHGKLDRLALTAPRDDVRAAERSFVAPRTATEQALARIWIDILGVGEVGAFDNFFELGGHSLLAGQIMARVANATGVLLPIRTIFEAPTIEALARRLDIARQTRPGEQSSEQSCESWLEISHARTRGFQPLSVMQESVLRMERELPGLPQFNLSFAFQLKGPLNVNAFQRALAEIVRRHDSLRTSFAWKNGQAVASIANGSQVKPPLIIKNLAAGTPRGGDRANRLLLRKAELVAEQEAWMPFDLKRAPLFRMRLLRLRDDDHVLLVVLHHIIIDGWSIGVLFEEISTLYAAFAARRSAQLPAPALQFADVTRWQRRWTETSTAEQQVADWREHLRDASPLFPSADRSILLASPVAYEPVRLTKDLVARLSALGSARCATLFMTLLAGFKTMLLAQSGRNDICVATAMANRSHEKAERVVGLVENTTIVRTRLELDLSFGEALDRVRHAVLEAHARQQLPFDILATRMAQEDGLELASITQAFFILQNAFRPLRLPDVAVRPFGDVFRQGQAVMPVDRTWLAVTLKEIEDGIIGSCCYKTELFESDTLQSWIANFRTILAMGVENPQMSLGRLAEHGSIACQPRPAATNSA